MPLDQKFVQAVYVAYQINKGQFLPSDSPAATNKVVRLFSEVAGATEPFTAGFMCICILKRKSEFSHHNLTHGIMNM